MENNEPKTVDQCIRDVARQFAATGLSIPAIEGFLRTGRDSWEGAGSGRFTRAQLDRDSNYREAARAALRTLFDRLAELLPLAARSLPLVTPDTIRQRVEPMVRGVVQPDRQDVALRELSRRTFVLNLPGTKAALEAELSTGWLGTAWKILWVYFAEHRLKPDEVQIDYDGLSGGEFAHVGWSAYQTTDPYSDVVVHEAAHLLHNLKPELYGFRVRRGQGRFVDVEFHHRELFAFACEAYSRVVSHDTRKARMAFAGKMRADAFSFSVDYVEEVAALVALAASARNGWRTIRDATLERPSQRRMIAKPNLNIFT